MQKWIKDRDVLYLPEGREMLHLYFPTSQGENPFVVTIAQTPHSIEGEAMFNQMKGAFPEDEQTLLRKQLRGVLVNTTNRAVNKTLTVNNK